MEQVTGMTYRTANPCVNAILDISNVSWSWLSRNRALLTTPSYYTIGRCSDQHTLHTAFWPNSDVFFCFSYYMKCAGSVSNVMGANKADLSRI